MQPRKVSNAALAQIFAPAEPSQLAQEVRCAVRFPLKMPITVSMDGAEFTAHSFDVSATGILFELDRHLPLGMRIRFSLRMPARVLGTSRDVLVHCVGRVVRCSKGQTQFQVAATIDEYQFAEQ